MRKFIKTLIIVFLVALVVTCGVMLGVLWWSIGQYNNTLQKEPLELPIPKDFSDDFTFEEGMVSWSANDLESWIWQQNIPALNSLDIQFTDSNAIWLRCSLDILEDRFINLDTEFTVEWSSDTIPLNISQDTTLDTSVDTELPTQIMKGYWIDITPNHIFIGEQNIQNFVEWFYNSEMESTEGNASDNSSYSELFLPIWVRFRLENPVVDEVLNNVQSISIQNQIVTTEFREPTTQE
jgi:hypothetical protein